MSVPLVDGVQVTIPPFWVIEKVALKAMLSPVRFMVNVVATMPAPLPTS